MGYMFLFGFVSGMRTMTAIAVLCWFGWLGLLPFEHTWAFWTANLVSVVIFSLLAAGEYVGDVLPQTPSRRDWPLALARLAFGGLTGALAATAIREPVAGGVLCGMLGAAVGTWGGWWARMRLGRFFGLDLPAGLLESAFALGEALFAAHWLHVGVIATIRVEPLIFR
jgi:uncharacterized membrane protein